MVMMVVVVVVVVMVTLENEPHVPRSRFTVPATKSERPEDFEDHHRVQSISLPRNLHIEVKPLEKPTLDLQSTRFPLRLPRKVTTKPGNVHVTTTRAQSRRAPAPTHQFLQACAVDVHFEDLEVSRSRGE